MIKYRNLYEGDNPDLGDYAYSNTPPRLHFEKVNANDAASVGIYLDNVDIGYVAYAEIDGTEFEFVADGDDLYILSVFDDNEEDVYIECKIKMSTPNQFGKVANEIMQDICNHRQYLKDADTFKKFISKYGVIRG